MIAVREFLTFDLVIKLLQVIATFKEIFSLPILTNVFSFRNERFYCSFLRVVVTFFDRNEGQPFSEMGIFKCFMESKFVSCPGAN